MRLTATTLRGRASDWRHRIVLGETDNAVAVLAGLGTPFENLARDQPGILPDRPLDLLGDFGMLLEELFGVLPALADSPRIEREPGAGFLDDACLDPEIDEL